VTPRLKWLLGSLGLALVLYGLSRTQRGGEIISNIVGGSVDKIAKLIVGEEGDKLTVYRDPGAGAWTVGKGHLILSTDTVMRAGASQKLHPFGPVTDITQAESDSFFKNDISVATHAVDNAVKVLLTSNQRAALISLVFNIGVTAWKASTILRKLNASDFVGAANEFSRWIYDNGVIVEGLVDRRERERNLFLS